MRVRRARLGLGLIAATLAIEAVAELVFAYGLLTRPIRGVFLLLVSGTPPVLAGLALLLSDAPPRRERLAYGYAFLVFAIIFALSLSDLAGHALGPWADAAASLFEVSGFAALLFALRERPARAGDPARYAGTVVVALRAGAGVVQLVDASTSSSVLLAVSAAAMFAVTARIAQRARLRSAPT